MKLEKIGNIKKDIKLSVSIMLCIFFYVFFTNPNSLPLILMLGLPVLISVAGLVLTRLVLNVFFEMPTTLISVLSRSVAIGILLIMMLGALKQLRVQDILLALLLVLGLSFYFARIAAKKEDA